MEICHAVFCLRNSGNSETWTWRFGDIETWRHGDIDKETWKHGDTELWSHGDMDMETWKHQMETEAQAIFLNPSTVCSSYKRKFAFCPLIDEETNGSYPFAN